MPHFLSIIMPCYNSSRTIEAAIRSVFEQKLDFSFELIIIDDESTDETAFLVERAKTQYKNIRFFKNEKNSGGGATRNRGIEKSRGDLIFCLDSDDILPDGMLQKLILFLDQEKLDGVVFEESKFFIWNPIISISAKNPQSLIGKKIVFENLFQTNSYLTQVNFLYTKKAFTRVGGYPIHHGFDTQEFGYRFLGLGLEAAICPGSYYFHRQGYGKSYFEREYETGALSKNYYLILEDLLYLFSPKTIDEILSFDIFSHTGMSQVNLTSHLQLLYKKIGKKMFSSHSSWDDWKIDQKKRKKITQSDFFLQAILEYKKGKILEAIKIYTQIIEKGTFTPIVRYNLLRCVASLGSSSQNEQNVDTFLRSVQFQPQRSIVSDSIFTKVLRKGTQTLNKLFS